MKRTEASLSYVQCFLYLISSSTNVSFLLHDWIHSRRTLYILRVITSALLVDSGSESLVSEIVGRGYSLTSPDPLPTSLMQGGRGLKFLAMWVS